MSSTETSNKDQLLVSQWNDSNLTCSKWKFDFKQFKLFYNFNHAWFYVEPLNWAVICTSKNIEVIPHYTAWCTAPGDVQVCNTSPNICLHIKLLNSFQSLFVFTNSAECVYLSLLEHRISFWFKFANTQSNFASCDTHRLSVNVLSSTKHLHLFRRLWTFNVFWATNNQAFVSSW